MLRKFILSRFVTGFILLSGVYNASAQDLDYVQMLTDTLGSRYMAGRGYTDQGSLKAAVFIASELRKSDAKPLTESYLQPFSIPMNTIRGKVECLVDGKALKAGSEFVVSSFSTGTNATFKLVDLPKKAYKSVRHFSKFLAKYGSDQVMLVIDLEKAENEELRKQLRMGQYQPIPNIAGAVYLSKKQPGWHVSRASKALNYIVVTVFREAWPADAERISLNFRNHFDPEYPTQNVCAYIPGTTNQDSFIVFTAHYDHLGMMGEDIYFPGINDNASGTAMLLDLARYYSKNPPGDNVAFLFFGAEEAGLWGSLEFASNPLIDLEKIRLLINLDMVGSGSEGITLVNGSVYKEHFSRIKNINDEKGYVKEVKARGESYNSDHAPFHEKGVPSFFIYTRGKEYMEYHTINDDGPLPLTAYEGLFKLLIESTDF